MTPLAAELELARLEAIRSSLEMLVAEYTEALCHGGPLPPDKQYMTIPQLQFWLHQRIARARDYFGASACPGA
jgi:hypothetical protein